VVYSNDTCTKYMKSDGSVNLVTFACDKCVLSSVISECLTRGYKSETAFVSASNYDLLMLLPVTFCAIIALYALSRMVAASYFVNDGYDEVTLALSYSIMNLVYMSLCVIS